MRNKLKYIFASVFICISNMVIFAEMVPPPDNIGDGDGASETEGAIANVPIDMYEGILIIVAVAMIVGYYFYNRNRRLAN